MESLLKVENLCKSYKRCGREINAVQNANIELSCGEAVGIVGSSGSGKSTLLRLISGLESPDSGCIYLDGRKLPSKRSISDKRDIQMIFQDAPASFHPKKTIMHSINDAAQSLMGRDAQIDYDKLFSSVGLNTELARRYPSALSGGQCQRFAIARSLVFSPRVLLCDEITSALDVFSQEQVIKLLSSLCRDKGTAVIFVSHDIALVSGFCDRITVIDGGKTVEEGNTQALLASPKNDCTKKLISSVMEIKHGEY
jgi:peptide/nickel transport system ATP-binding protein